MKNYKHSNNRNNSGGFTLIELLVVIAIVGLLASIILSNLNRARIKAQDAKRMSDLHNIQLALELYYDKYGTYKVAEAGSSGRGTGWLGYENGTSYKKAITRVLYEEGFYGAPLVDDPVQSPGYKIHLCPDSNGKKDQVYALFAKKAEPTAYDSIYIKSVCNGVRVSNVYKMNYAVGNN